MLGGKTVKVNVAGQRIQFGQFLHLVGGRTIVLKHADKAWSRGYVKVGEAIQASLQKITDANACGEGIPPQTRAGQP